MGMVVTLITLVVPVMLLGSFKYSNNMLWLDKIVDENCEGIMECNLVGGLGRGCTMHFYVQKIAWE